MKKILSILLGLLIFPVFAEVAPVYYDTEMEEYIDEEYTDEDVDIVNEQTQPVKATTKKATVQRSVSRGTNTSNAKVTTRGSSTNSRAVASTRGNATVSNRSAVNRTTKKVSSRTPTTTSRTKVTSRTASNNRPTVARIGTTGSVIGGIKSTTGSAQQTLTSNGSSLYNATKVGSGIRVSTQRLGTARAAASTTTNVTDSDISSTTTNMENLTELTEYCKAQYASCMDDYCNVLDENQGRCSCSKNIKNYEKTEASLAEATETLQQVVQQIKYIGLTTAQVETLFTETEAELTLSGYKSDTTTLAKSLDSIKKNILDVSTPKAANTTSNLSMTNGLFDFDLGSGFDISSFLGTTGSTNNVSNQRGETLHKTATQRCKTSVLNTCVSQGVDANLITNSYDLEIDKHCIAYEKSLKSAIDDVKTNVSNATVILQQARLMLAQNKNAYGLRDCVSALDTCMQDELICGDDYEFCLDPTGKYINEGNIILGSTPGIAGGYVNNQTEIPTNNTNWISGGMTELYSVWNYEGSTNVTNVSSGVQGTNYNAWGDGALETVSDYIDKKLDIWKEDYASTKSTTDMALFLLRKIGYIDIDNKKAEKVHGLCANVFQQCQDYTFETKSSGKNISKKYIYDNDVVKQYLAMVLPRIRAKQDTLLSEYAEDCMSDVESCLSTNGYDNEKPNAKKSDIAVDSCRSYIATCMSVSGYKPSNVRSLTSKAMAEWVKLSQSLEDDDSEEQDTPENPTTPTTITCDAGKYLPANSTTCTQCTVGNYCVGGTWSKSSTDQGLTACTTGTSPAGATSSSQCQTSAPTTCTSSTQYLANGVCKDCPFGTEATSPTATSCTCKSGYTIKTDDGACYKESNEEIQYKYATYNNYGTTGAWKTGGDLSRISQNEWEIGLPNNDTGITSIIGKGECKQYDNDYTSICQITKINYASIANRVYFQGDSYYDTLAQCNQHVATDCMNSFIPENYIKTSFNEFKEFQNTCPNTNQYRGYIGYLSRSIFTGICNTCPFGTEATSPTATSCSCKSGYTLETSYIYGGGKIVEGCYANPGTTTLPATAARYTDNDGTLKSYAGTTFTAASIGGKNTFNIQLANNTFGINLISGTAKCVYNGSDPYESVCQITHINQDKLTTPGKEFSHSGWTSESDCLQHAAEDCLDDMTGTWEDSRISIGSIL